VNILDLAEVCGEEITLTYFPNQGGRWCCRFSKGAIKDGRMLAGVHGNGQTPSAAIMDYARQLRGHRLVFHDMDPDRRHECNVPKGLECP